VPLPIPPSSWDSKLTAFSRGRFEGFEWGISAIILGELRLGVLQAVESGSGFEEAIDLSASPAVRGVSWPLYLLHHIHM
jgi:hypothetical protein